MHNVHVSQIIKQAAQHKMPGAEYFDNFLPAYKRFHQRRNVQRRVLAFAASFAVFIVACACISSINNDNALDIPTAAGIDMSNHHTQHGRVVVMNGDVIQVTAFIKKNVGPHETLSLKEYFQGDDVYGVYVPGDEKFRYYYQCLGNGKYSVFTYNE